MCPKCSQNVPKTFRINKATKFYPSCFIFKCVKTRTVKRSLEHGILPCPLQFLFSKKDSL